MTQQWKTGRKVTSWDVRNLFLHGKNTVEIAEIVGLTEAEVDTLHWSWRRHRA